MWACLCKTNFKCWKIMVLMLLNEMMHISACTDTSIDPVFMQNKSVMLEDTGLNVIHYVPYTSVCIVTSMIRHCFYPSLCMQVDRLWAVPAVIKDTSSDEYNSLLVWYVTRPSLSRIELSAWSGHRDVDSNEKAC